MYRILSRSSTEGLSVGHFASLIGRAVDIRRRLFVSPFYRAVNAEGDGIPGVFLDRSDPRV